MYRNDTIICILCPRNNENTSTSTSSSSSEDGEAYSHPTTKSINHSASTPPTSRSRNCYGSSSNQPLEKHPMAQDCDDGCLENWL